MMDRRSSNRVADTSTQHPPIIASTATSSPTGDNKADLASLINRVRKKVNDVRPEQNSLGPCTIFEIPAHIRRLDPLAYKPAVVPIGPFHHVLRRESAIQEHKWRCVRYLLSRHPKDQSSELLDKCLWALKELDEDVRSCYSKKLISVNAHDMAEIMLLDGCFIIHLLLKHANKEKEEHAKEEKEEHANKEQEEKKEREKGDVVLEVHHERKEGWEIMGKEKGKEEQASDVGSGKRVRGTLSGKNEKEDFEALLSKQEMVKLEIEEDREEIKGPFEAGLFTVKVALYDLLKLENQIPFFIIQILFDLLKIPKDGDINIPQRVLDLFCNIQPSLSNSFETTSIASIHHLLHLFHSSRVFQPHPPQQEKPLDATGCKWIPSATKVRQTGVKSRKKKKPSDTTGSEWIPSATELRRAGVKFRKRKDETNFLDIKFDNGRMEIPPLRVTDHTCSLFRNLIAFEQCYAGAMTYITTYAVFMDCIIDEAKDAQLLHLRGILVNRLSTDKALAGLFNKLCNEIHYSSNNNHLADLFMEVHGYYNSKFHKWRADFKRNYFSSPWTIISVIAAVLLLLLTIEQAVLAGFSYLHPLDGS